MEKVLICFSMPFPLEEDAVTAVFLSPFCDGGFEPDFFDYLNDLGALRRSVVLAFAPKAAGTYLRSAAIVATDGALVRTCHAQGGRDASFYMPTFVNYFAGGHPRKTLVTHVHMQALPANQRFIEAFDLKPAIMIRAIPDMLASYADMLTDDPLFPDNWLNIAVPQDYAALSPEQRNDFLVDMMGPWYASYFATWLDYARRDPRVLVLDYDEFRTDPVPVLMRLLDHSGLSRSEEACEVALNGVWEDRGSFRFNKGVSGRGRLRFTSAQIARLERQLGYYPNLGNMKERLIPPP
jgi:hypothetical protein